MKRLHAAYIDRGRWSRKENRPMHAVRAGEDRTLCGVRDPTVFFEHGAPVPFDGVLHKCSRCERFSARAVQDSGDAPPAEPQPKREG